MSNQKLIKVAKEFNVGLHSIVETLRKDGFDIDEKPMADVTEQMYAVLRSKFKVDLETKKQADQMARPVISGRPNIGLPPLNPLPPMPPKQASAPVVPVEEKPKPVAAEPAPQTPQKEEEPEVITVSDAARGRIGLHVVGKIDLEKKRAPKPDTPKTEAPKPPAAKAEPLEPEMPAAPMSLAKPEAPEPAPLPEPPAPVATDSEDDVIRAKGEELRGLKILGKVDLNKFKPPAPEPRPKNDHQRGGGQGRQGDQRGGQNRPQSQGGGSQDGERHRRKRVTVSGAPVSADTVRQSLGQAQEATGRKRDGRAAPVGGEISQKQIDDQIRQTMARLGVGSKSKRQKIRRDKRDVMREKAEMAELAAMEGGSKLQVTEFISASDLAGLLGVSPAQVVAACFQLSVV